MLFEQALKIVQEDGLHSQTDENLQLMIKACLAVRSGNPAIQITVQQVASVIQDEIERREKAKQHSQQLEGQSRLKTAVEELRRPHWTLTPSFWVAVLAMIFAAIAAWPVIHGWFQAALPANTAARFQPPQTNSAPLKPEAPKTTTVVSNALVVSDTTNQILKKDSN